MTRSDDLGHQVNQLYWETDEPVTRLAERLDVSRATFYNYVTPKPTGAACPDCDAPLAFRTRANRDAGEAECTACGAEAAPGDAGDGAAEPADVRSDAEKRQTRRPDAGTRPERPRRTRDRSLPDAAPVSAPAAWSGGRPALSMAAAQEHGEPPLRRLVGVVLGGAALGFVLATFAIRR